MKKITTGAAVLLTGAIMFLSTFVASSNTELITGWNTARGRFWSGVSQAKLFPVLVISIIMMIVGIVFLILGNRKEK